MENRKYLMAREGDVIENLNEPTTIVVITDNRILVKNNILAGIIVTPPNPYDVAIINNVVNGGITSHFYLGERLKDYGTFRRRTIHT